MGRSQSQFEHDASMSQFYDAELYSVQDSHSSRAEKANASFITRDHCSGPLRCPRALNSHQRLALSSEHITWKAKVWIGFYWHRMGFDNAILGTGRPIPWHR